MMAAAELRDYLENGIIHNSVNLPNIAPLGAPEGHRVLVIHQNVPGLVNKISGVVADRGVNIHNMVNKSKGEMAVTVMELSDLPDAALTAALAGVENVLRVRSIGE